ncbi:unnamed protein product [Protopolystoma xenopodis]|uniref:Uncharacterized protein n=1 Tax=Protopolystoma xenopodis TaxID=117903 RepID=A0A448WG57_9PLAT|nr:unnamed protein product [Protopolystoma xenopodis]
MLDSREQTLLIPGPSKDVELKLPQLSKKDQAKMLGFIHASFSHGDVVIFVPVPGNRHSVVTNHGNTTASRTESWADRQLLTSFPLDSDLPSAISPLPQLTDRQKASRLLSKSVLGLALPGIPSLSSSRPHITDTIPTIKPATGERPQAVTSSPSKTSESNDFLRLF